MMMMDAAAEAAATPVPMADVVHDALLEAVAHGNGDRDCAALAGVAMRHAGEQRGARSPV
jgi:hypothetical protein